jgi:hypothetical protein
MSGAPQVAMRSTSQIWQIFFPSQTLQVFCFSFAKPLDFLFGPSQKGTICSSVRKKVVTYPKSKLCEFCEVGYAHGSFMHQK